MLTEQQYELAAKFADDERAVALEALRKRMQDDAPGSPDGACQNCGEDIGQARLAAKPGAARCIDCQVIHEKKQQQRARY